MLNRVITVMLGCAMLAGANVALAQPKLENAWIRLMPPNAGMTAAYAHITSDAKDRLMSVKTEIATKAEIHETTMENGMMSMRPIESIAFSAGETVELKPQGKHIMLIGLTRALQEGEEVPVLLEFAESGVQSHLFTVHKP
ncbi:hypothetical protein A3760_26320 [Oleiphilus sp. HI0122]|jgi:copper(I)-binding protein|uniref:copper chaperone PCu(A)C n=2 Tax=Oleiphilus TaxID=141450 RepID=UPI0007C3295B|nr:MULTISPECIES: copper chaperone PCu(A)C [unclassified Oleiphilus]KZZ51361.1 hypothetical protein A3760_12620 [Oleiphilus sp. HI0122]KZZ60896.1 hypothetical protein A3760_26320 [Oleiphilus sp. HI0122]